MYLFCPLAATLGDFPKFFQNKPSLSSESLGWIPEEDSAPPSGQCVELQPNYLTPRNPRTKKPHSRRQSAGPGGVKVFVFFFNCNKPSPAEQEC